jgi:hypothetical protein
MDLMQELKKSKIKKIIHLLPDSLWLRQLVTGFDSRAVYKKFVVDKVALRQACPRLITFLPIKMFPVVVFIHFPFENSQCAL